MSYIKERSSPNRIALADGQPRSEQVAHLRQRMRAVVFRAFPTASDAAELLSDTYALWRQDPLLTLPLDKDEHSAKQRLATSETFLDTGTRVLGHAGSWAAGKNFLLKVSAGNDLMCTAERILGRQFTSTNRGKEYTIETSTGRLITLPFNIAYLQANGRVLSEVGQLNNVALYADHPKSKFFAETIAGIAEASGYVPEADNIYGIFFLDTLDRGSGAFYPEQKVIRIGTAGGLNDSADCALHMSVYIHEKRHSELPEMFGVIEELDAFYTQFDALQTLAFMSFGGRFNGLVSPEEFTDRLFKESFKASRKSSSLMERVAAPMRPLETRLLADHNIASSQRRNDTRA